jgi:hypothetical protein
MSAITRMMISSGIPMGPMAVLLFRVATDGRRAAVESKEQD